MSVSDAGRFGKAQPVGGEAFDPADGRAWRRLAREIARRVWRRDQAEDYLHAAFVKLTEYKATGRVENERAFLMRTAVNLSIDQQRRARFVSEDALEGKASAIADLAPLPDEVIEHRRRLDKVQRRLDRMSPRTREVFLLHRIDGLKYREIADRLKITQSAVEKHIARAMLALEEEAES